MKIEVRVPDVGELDNVEVVEVLVAAGDRVAAEDSLITLESDKASMDVPAVIGMEAGLSFLGLGVSAPTPSWGSILNDGYSYLRNSPWPIIAGGIPLILVTLGFTFFGESLRDILDPKLRKKGGGS